MKNLFLIANWKANKTEEEAIVWLEEFDKNKTIADGEWEAKEVIICPSYPVLTRVYDFIQKNKLPLRAGSQDVSKFGRGAYTGEVPPALLEKFVRFSIIGHSERRKYFNEDDDVLRDKVNGALSGYSLPVFCVQNENTFIPQGVKIIAYEPVEAIGTGNPDTPENAEKVASFIKEKNKDVTNVLYGGSVTSENVNSFTKMPNIDGALVGGASLNPLEFLRIIKNA